MNNIEIKKYDYIDALRGFAILGVVLVHSSQWVSPESYIFGLIAGQGQRGVQLFYLASALTLFLSMSARKKQEKKPLQSFYIRRFFRIAPAFYSAIIVYTLYYGMEARYWAPNGLDWWYLPITALFLHGWHPETINSVVEGGWSIAVEMTFYLFLPLLFKHLKSIKITLVVLLASLILSRVLSFTVVNLLMPYFMDGQKYLVPSFTNFWFFSQLPVFITGILLYHIIVKYPSGDKLTSFLLLLMSLFLFVAFLTVQTFYELLPQQVLYGFAFLLFALSLYYWPQKILVNRCTIFIGRLSFSIYLVHFMVINILKRIFPDGFVYQDDIGFFIAYGLVLSMSVAASYVTYKFIEIPGIKLGKKIIKKI